MTNYILTGFGKYLNRIVIAFSILVNCLMGGRNNQTFSARNWQRKRDKKFNLVWLIDGIFFMQRDHCQDSWVKWTIIDSAVRKYSEVMGFDNKNSRNLWE